MSLCTNCGLCCKYPDGTDCKWLRWKDNGESYCRIYLTRLFRDIGHGCLCWPIMSLRKLYAGCPYNLRKFIRWSGRK